jgi:hypothetical protein
MDGKRFVTLSNGGLPSPDDLMQVMHPSGSSADYKIGDGHILTTVDGTPFELTVYSSGNKFIAARSNEFGYANYEVQTAEK